MQKEICFICGTGGENTTFFAVLADDSIVLCQCCANILVFNEQSFAARE